MSSTAGYERCNKISDVQDISADIWKKRLYGVDSSGVGELGAGFKITRGYNIVQIYRVVEFRREGRTVAAIIISFIGWSITVIQVIIGI